MATFDTFKNCYNFSDVQTKVIAHVRGVSAACCLLCHLVYSSYGACDTRNSPKDKKSTVWNCF